MTDEEQEAMHNTLQYQLNELREHMLAITQPLVVPLTRLLERLNDALEAVARRLNR